MPNGTRRYYATTCEECAREFLAHTGYTASAFARCGYCVARGKLGRRTHPEDIREAHLQLANWLAQQGAWLRLYAYQPPDVAQHAASIARIEYEGWETEDIPF